MTDAKASEVREGTLVHVDLDLLDDNPYQPRTEIEPAKLEELASSIAATGLLQPIAVRPVGGGRYQIVAGHRRVAAFKKLKSAAQSEEERRNYRLIPATVKRHFDDLQMAVGAFVENVSRADLNPLEEAAALVRIRDLIGAANAKALAVAVSQNEQRVRRLLRLHESPKVVRDAVTTGLLVDVERSAGDDQGAQPRRERRRLDLLAALEFARLYEHALARAPKTAEERVTNAIGRALSDNWGFRRIQEFVAASVDGRVAEAMGRDGTPTARPPATPVIERSATRLTVHLDRLDRALPEHLTALANDLRALLLDTEKRLAKPAFNVE